MFLSYFARLFNLADYRIPKSNPGRNAILLELSVDFRVLGSLAIVFRNLVNRFTVGLIINIKQAQANGLAWPLTQALQAGESKEWNEWRLQMGT